MKTKGKVLLAMSGGVDSSVAALLLKKQGYNIIGVFMKNWSDTKDDLGECTWKGDRKEAIKVASKLGIPLITLDFEKEYRKLVVEEMYNAYRLGFTPNPDVDCNNKIKFPLLWKAAKKLGCNFVATGHYARVKKIKIISKNKSVNIKSASLANSGLNRGDGWEYSLLRATDESKDQSYFLYRLTSKDLSHTLFPIGDYKKTGVRKIAKTNGFENYERKSTTGICFIGKVNLKKFLQKKIKPKKGKILNAEGKLVGFHDGIYYYTIGQRIGPRFGIDIDKGKDTRRWYVASKNPKKNEIIAAPEGHPLLLRKEIFIKQPHWINNDSISKRKNTITNEKRVNINSYEFREGGWDRSIKILSRIRQLGELLPSQLSYDKKKKSFKIILSRPVTGISEGQAIVLYQGTVCIGGGVIGF